MCHIPSIPSFHLCIHVLYSDYNNMDTGQHAIGLYDRKETRRLNHLVYKCEYCGKKFDRLVYLHMHTWKRHTNSVSDHFVFYADDSPV